MNRAAIEAVLAEHRPKPGRAYQCTCGHWATNHKNPDMAASHRTHVAAALDAALAQEGDQGEAVDESAAQAGEVWQEADNVVLLCIEPGVTWRDFRGDNVPWDAPLITRPLRRLLDGDGRLVAAVPVAGRRGNERQLDELELLMVAGWPSPVGSTPNECLTYARRAIGRVRDRRAPQPQPEDGER